MCVIRETGEVSVGSNPTLTANQGTVTTLCKGTTVTQDLLALSRKWAPESAGHNWQGTVNGYNLDVRSPTADNETLGQTICRLGGDFYRESQTLGSNGPNKATIQEAKDICVLYPEAKTWFNTAMNRGLDIRVETEDPVQQMFDAMQGHPAGHPIGDVNPRYANLVGDFISADGGTAGSTGFVGSPQVGHVTSSVLPGPEDDEEVDD